MATKFIEPGGDADFGIALWTSIGGASAVATDFVNGAHIKSIKYRPAQADTLQSPFTIFSASAGRINIWIYLVALPNATAAILSARSDGGTTAYSIRLTNAGVLQIWTGTSTAQIGSNGSTLATGKWYKLCLSFTTASTTVNEIRLFLNTVLDISISNATLPVGTIGHFRLGNIETNTTLDYRSSDHYADNSNALTDVGNIWITAKRPNANGTTNGFSTQIGSGGSGYGAGHSPQVNERALSTTNGWSMVGAGSAVTEEYNIENAATGDINIAAAILIDYMGWVYAKSALSETASIIVNNATSNISLTSTNTMFTKIAGSTTYPAGSGTDIGIITATTVTTVSLYECGIIFAYLAPPVGKAVNINQAVNRANTY